MTTAAKVSALAARLAAAPTPVARIALANDPASGPLAVRMLALIESGKAGTL